MSDLLLNNIPRQHMSSYLFYFLRVEFAMGLQDRKKTIEDLKSFLNTKIAPKDLIDDVKVPFLFLFMSTSS